MSRNGSGTYSVPNSFVAGTSITAADHNENWTDVASEVTNSVAADGQTTMTGPLKASSGTAAAPSHSFGADTDTGAYRSAANEYSVAVGGSQVAAFSSAGINIKVGSLLFNGVAVTYPFVAADIAAGAIGTSELADGNVTKAKIENASAQGVGLFRKTSAAGPYEEATLSEQFNTIASVARGDIWLRGAANWARKALGASGTFLTSDGTDLVYGTQTMQKIDTQTAAAASALTFVTGISSSYRKYIVDIDNLVANTAATTLSIEVTDDGGSSWKQTTYLSTGFFQDGSGPTLATDSNLTTAVRLTPAGATTGNTAGIGYSGVIEFHNPSSTSVRKMINTRGGFLRNGGTTLGISTTSGFWNGGNGALNGIRIVAASGTLTGVGTLYGIA